MISITLNIVFGYNLLRVGNLLIEANNCIERNLKILKEINRHL